MSLLPLFTRQIPDGLKGSDMAGELGTLSDLVLVNQIQLAIVVLFAYEYVITFSKEVSLFWMRKKTGASWLFFAVRYLALFNYAILGGVSHLPMSDKSCKGLQKAVFSVQFIQFVPWAAFSALRTLALSKMNWPLASSVFVLGAAYLAVSAWQVSLAGIAGGNLPLVGCTGGPNLTPEQDLIAVVVSRSCGMVADAIVIIVTWRYALKHRAARVFAAERGMLSSLGRVLLINGTVYFVVILVINAIQIIPLLSVLGRQSPVVQFFVIVDPLTAILICRFMFALQAANQKAIHGRAFNDTLLETGNFDHYSGEMGFASAFVGSMGGTIPSELDSSLTDSDHHQIIEMERLPRKE